MFNNISAVACFKQTEIDAFNFNTLNLVDDCYLIILFNGSTIFPKLTRESFEL